MESIDCIFLSFLALDIISLMSSIHISQLLLLNLRYDFNTNLLFFMIFDDFFLTILINLTIAMSYYLTCF